MLGYEILMENFVQKSLDEDVVAVVAPAIARNKSLYKFAEAKSE